MRVLRAKQVRKHLRFYRIVFAIEAPYHVILDGNFIFSAIKFKVDLRSRLEKVLSDTGLKLYVLRSVLEELKAVGSKAQQALQFAESYCEIIEDEALPGDVTLDKLVSLLGDQGKSGNAPTKTRKYFIASQDKEVRAVLGSKSGIPIIYLNKVTLVLEPPSNYSKETNVEIEQGKSKLNQEEADLVDQIELGTQKRKRGGSGGVVSSTTAALLKDGAGAKDDSAVQERKKRKASQPNPLASQKASEDSSNSKKKKSSKYRA